MSSSRGIEEKDVVDQSRISKIVSVAALISACGFTLLCFARLMSSGLGYAPVLGIGAVCSVLIFFLGNRGHVRVAAVSLILLMVGLATYLIIASEGTHDAALLTFPGILVLGALTLPRRIYAPLAAFIVLMPTLVGVLELRKTVVSALAAYTDVLSVVDLSVILLLTAAAVELMTRTLTESSSRARSSEKRFGQLFNNSAESIFVLGAIGPDGMPGRILEVNDACSRQLGYSYDELIRMSPLEILDPESRHKASEVIAGLGAAGSATCECTYRRSDGTRIPMEVSIRAFEMDGEQTIISNARDVTERRRADSLLKSALREKEVLLREIHHRVKNNMQVVSSLLNLQASQTEDPVTRGMLEESRQRVRSIALIHEKLFRSANLADVDFASYLKSVADELLRTFGRPEVTCILDLEPIQLEIDKAIPVGLIVNELLTNTLRHAFPPGTKGTARVTLHATSAEDVELVVQDDGVGFPGGLDGVSANSIGLAIVRTLVEQLHGTMTIEARRGTTCTIRFKREAKDGE